MLIKDPTPPGPGGRVTDAEDLPAEKTGYAIRDLDHLRRPAASEGPAIGAYADALLDTRLPWTKMHPVTPDSPGGLGGIASIVHLH